MMICKKFARVFALCLAAATLAAATEAAALDYPTRPVRWIVGYPAGGTTDIVARIIGAWLSERLGQQFIVENKPGAGNNIATAEVARAAPDGYTMLLVNPANAINTTLYRHLPFNFMKDVAPVAGFMRVPNVMEVNPSVPANTVAEFIAYAKANPGKINWASSGNGTSVHLSGELFKIMTGVELTHVPYRGSAPAVQDLIGGHIGSMFLPVHVGLPLAKDNQIRLLAVANNERVSVAPDVPTLIEQGIQGVDIDFWLGMLAPAATPVANVERYNGVLNDILRAPRIANTLKAQGFVAVGGSARDFGVLIAKDLAKWRKVVRGAAISPE